MKSQLKITNTLSRKKEVFEPLNPPFVGLYVCGPTVYSEPHLGNLRTFLAFDIVYRWLLYLGYNVRYVRNITDVGHIENSAGNVVDGIGERAKAENLEPMEIVQKYTNNFHWLTRTFNMLNPSIEPTATGHMVEQWEMIQRIIDNGYGYESNESVYFDVNKYAESNDYGKLSGRKIDELIAGSRDLDGQDEKRNPLDFAIWKAVGPSFPQRWKSPWGWGVPGWNLECSVMSTKYLGTTFDIHGGGMDLKFPHHECEIAQSVAADKAEPVKYWMHSNMLTVNGTKMSKSLGNAFLPAELIAGEHELLEKGYSPMVVRFFMLQTHYSSTIDFSNEALQAAEKGFERLMNAKKVLNEFNYSAGDVNAYEDQSIIDTLNAVKSNMNDDFNTAQALAQMFELCSKINSFKDGHIDLGSITQETFETLKATFNTIITEVFGLMDEVEGSNDAMDGVMQLLVEIRNESREKKDWATSDKIRDQLNALNIKVKDEKDGSTSWSL